MGNLETLKIEDFQKMLYHLEVKKIEEIENNFWAVTANYSEDAQYIGGMSSFIISGFYPKKRSFDLIIQSQKVLDYKERHK